MIILLINQSAIFPILKEQLDANPINVFTSYYEAFSMDTVVDFDEWLTTFVLPNKLDDFDKGELFKKIENTLSNPAALRRATFRLYPLQYEFIEQNYPKIKETLSRVYKDKRCRDLKLLRFTELLKTFNKNINTVHYV